MLKPKSAANFSWKIWGAFPSGKIAPHFFPAGTVPFPQGASMIFEENEHDIERRLRAKENIRQVRARLEKAKKIRDAFEDEFRSRMVVFVSTAFGVVAALFWQTAIMDTIKAFLPVSGAWQYEILVAFLVTLLAVLVVFAMSKMQHARSQGN